MVTGDLSDIYPQARGCRHAHTCTHTHTYMLNKNTKCTKEGKAMQSEAAVI